MAMSCGSYAATGYYASGGTTADSASAELLAGGSDYPGTDLTLIKNNQITGTILLPGGAVAANDISLTISSSDVNGMMGGGSIGVTIPMGSSSISYALDTSPDAASQWRISYACNSGCAGYLSQGYYAVVGTTSDVNAADPLAGGVDHSSIDLTLLTGDQISGAVSLPNGELAPAGGLNVNVQASNQNGNANTSVYIAENSSSAAYALTVPSDGTAQWQVSYSCWDMMGMSCGSYAQTGYYADTETTWNSANAFLLTGNQDHVDIDMTLLRDYQITGDFFRPAGDPAMNDLYIDFVVVDQNGNVAYTLGWQYLLAGQSSLSYTLNVPADPSALWHVYYRCNNCDAAEFITPGYYATGGTTARLADATQWAISENQSGINLTLLSRNQTIIFDALADKTYGDADFALTATASSGLDVTFSSLTTAVCTVAGDTVTLMGAGLCTVRASQPGDTDYHAAPDVVQSFQVAKKSLNVVGLGADDKTYDGTVDATLNGTASLDGVVNSDDVTLTGVAAGSFADANVGNAKTVTITGLSLTGTKAGNYQLVSPVLVTASIIKADQSISFGSLSDKTYGDASFLLDASASSGLTVGFASLTPAACTLTGKTVAIQGAGICTIRASQSGNANYNSASDVEQNFTVATKELAITGLAANDKVYDGTVSAVLTGSPALFGVINGDDVNVIGTPVGVFDDANVGNGKTVTVSGVSLVGAKAGNYHLPVLTFTASITKADQTIVFTMIPGNKVYGDTSFDLEAVSTSNLSVSFISMTLPVCTVSGTTVNLLGAGNCTIRASQSGDSNYNAALDVDVGFSIVPKELTVTGLSVEDKVFDGTTDAVVAGSPVLSGVENGDDVSLQGMPVGVFGTAGAGIDKVVTISGISLMGSKADNYHLDLPVEVAATISKAPQTIAGFAVDSLILTTGESTKLRVVSLGASGNSVIFSSNTINVCMVSADIVTAVQVGDCEVVANQAGNVNFTAALEQSLVVQVVPAGCNDPDEDGIPDGIDATPFTTNPNVCASTGGVLISPVADGEQIYCSDSSLVTTDENGVEIAPGGLVSFVAPEVVLTPGFSAKMGSIVLINSKSSCAP